MHPCDACRTSPQLPGPRSISNQQNRPRPSTLCLLGRILCNSNVREDRLQNHMSNRCPSRLGVGSSVKPPVREINDCPREATKELAPRTNSKISPSFTTLSTKPIVTCPACQFKGLTDEFTRHFALAHGTKGRLRRRIQVPIVCLTGSSHPIVRQDKEEGKKKKITAVNPQNSAPVKPVPPSSPHTCGSLTSKPNSSPNPRKLTAREKRYRGRIARMQAREKKVLVHSANPNEKGSLRFKGKVEVESPSRWNNLDATNDYGYPAREAGRYGSHPSHDGFDDESKP